MGINDNTKHVKLGSNPVHSILSLTTSGLKIILKKILKENK